MKTSVAYGKQVEMMRKSNLYFEHNGGEYLISQIVVRKAGPDSIYRLYGTSTTESGTEVHYQDVPGDYDVRVKRILQKHDLYRYFFLIAAPGLTYWAYKLWFPIFQFRMFDWITLVLPMIVAILAIICWQMVRELWL